MRIRTWVSILLAVIVGLLALPPDSVRAEEEELPVRVTDVWFDHDDSSAIVLREDFYTTIPKPEWKKDERSGACLFVEESPITVLVRLEAPQWVNRAWFFAESDGPLGGLVGQWVNFEGGVSVPKYVPFTTERPAPSGIGKFSWEWRWKVARGPQAGILVAREFAVTGKHVMYTILAVPGLPWITHISSTQNPWTEALDVAIAHTNATTTQEALDDMVKFCFDRPCFQYDTVWGSPVYSNTVPAGWQFNLTLLLRDIREKRAPRTGCCYDGALIVHTFADLLGARTRYVLSGTPFTQHAFGYLNAIDPIGRGEDFCNNPFHSNYSVRDDPITYQDGTSANTGRSAFGNHSFAGTQAGANAVIWDATMCADIDPNRDTTVVVPPDGTWVSTDLTETTLTDANASWTPGEFIGMLLNPNTRTTNPEPYLEYLIVDNTETTITVVEGSNMLPFASAGNHYWIRDPEDPRTKIIYLLGLPWVDYESVAVDRIGAGGADPPVENNVDLR